MKRFAITALAIAALAVPTGAVAQDDAEATQAPLGVTTFDVCLAISGPVIQLTPEALTTGISDGTFVIEGLSNDCDTGLQAPDDDMSAEGDMGAEESSSAEAAASAEDDGY